MKENSKEKQSMTVIYSRFPSAEQMYCNPDLHYARMLQEMEGAVGIHITTTFANHNSRSNDLTKNAPGL